MKGISAVELHQLRYLVAVDEELHFRSDAAFEVAGLLGLAAAPTVTSAAGSDSPANATFPFITRLYPFFTRFWLCAGLSWPLFRIRSARYRRIYSVLARDVSHPTNVLACRG
jgi:hypothetical protein